MGGFSLQPFLFESHGVFHESAKVGLLLEAKVYLDSQPEAGGPRVAGDEGYAGLIVRRLVNCFFRYYFCAMRTVVSCFVFFASSISARDLNNSLPVGLAGCQTLERKYWSPYRLKTSFP